MSFELILPFLRPIEGLLLDENISEIMGNPDSSWWFEREGTLIAQRTFRSRLKGYELVWKSSRISSGKNLTRIIQSSTRNCPMAAGWPQLFRRWYGLLQQW